MSDYTESPCYPAVDCTPSTPPTLPPTTITVTSDATTTIPVTGYDSTVTAADAIGIMGLGLAFVAAATAVRRWRS